MLAMGARPWHLPDSSQCFVLPLWMEQEKSKVMQREWSCAKSVRARLRAEFCSSRWQPGACPLPPHTQSPAQPPRRRCWGSPRPRWGAAVSQCQQLLGPGSYKTKAESSSWQSTGCRELEQKHFKCLALPAWLLLCPPALVCSQCFITSKTDVSDQAETSPAQDWKHVLAQLPCSQRPYPSARDTASSRHLGYHSFALCHTSVCRCWHSCSPAQSPLHSKPKPQTSASGQAMPKPEAVPIG